MAGQRVSRRQKDISRVLRERKTLIPGDKAGKAKKGGKKRR
jgi:hypothetical protein